MNIYYYYFSYIFCVFFWFCFVAYTGISLLFVYCFSSSISFLWQKIVTHIKPKTVQLYAQETYTSWAFVFDNFQFFYCFHFHLTALAMIRKKKHFHSCIREVYIYEYPISYVTFIMTFYQAFYPYVDKKQT